MFEPMRRGIFGAVLTGLAALTSLAASDPAVAKPRISEMDCKIIARTFDEVQKKYHYSVILSPAFMVSMWLFLQPDKKKLTCSGRKDIEIATKYDEMAFKMVVKELLSANIDLKKLGVYTVPAPPERAATPDLLDQKPASPLPDPDKPVLFTMNECKVVAGSITQVLKVVSQKTPLSAAFRNSLIAFVTPDRKSITCDGPKEIVTETIEDVATFNTIRRELLDSKISLYDRGVRAVVSENTIFTQKECQSIYNVAAGIVGAIGIDNLSREFRQSLVNFFGTQNKCDGPRKIVTTTDRDAATFGQIRETLLAGPAPISLHDRGVRAVEAASK